MITIKHKRIYVTGFILFFSLAGISQNVKIILTNAIAIERPDELVILSRKTLERKLGPIATGNFVQLSDGKGRPMVVQSDDLDGDGKWDELAILQTFKPREKIVLRAVISNRPATVKAVVRAHVRLMKKNEQNEFGPQLMSETMPVRNPATNFAEQPLPMYLTEGPAWENDKVAFRQYLDVRNGRDIFGKRVRHMVMDSVGVATRPSYHDLADWGMDVLKVGKSLGAGSIAIQTTVNGKDSLVRLGGDDITNTRYEQVSDGPIRAIFRISYQWQIDGKPVTITDETSIWGGQYFYESKISVNGVSNPGKLVAGIVNLQKNISRHFILGNAAVAYSHGPQSENKDELGMAILVNRKAFAGFGRTADSASEITHTYRVSQTLNSTPLKYRFYAAWVLSDERFKSTTYFDKYMKKEAQKTSSAIVIL